MKKERTMKKIIISLALIAILAGCQNNGKEEMPGAANISGEITLTGLGDDHWTYFSFDKGDVIGTSTFASEKEDAEWAARTDWDFAICGDYLKTNGGESGIGQGGLQQDTEHNFATLEMAPENGYAEDIVQVIR